MPTATRPGIILFEDDKGQVLEYRPPQDKSELKYWLRLLFGMRVPDKAVCPNHQAPLDAIAAAYFAEAPVVVWHASRGLGGKTTALAAISVLELLTGADVNVLGGSGRQSQRVHDVVREAWSRQIKAKDERVFRSPLQYFIPEEPSTWKTKAINGATLVALTASTKSARGPHPQRLRMDEVDEMKQIVYDAAMGQALSSKGIRAQTTLSSTLQYPDGTMSYVLRLAAERNWPTYRWCFEETSVANGGWLTDQDIAEKRSSVSDLMWLVEYNLNEPSAEGRIFSAESLLLLFRPVIGLIHDRLGAMYEFEHFKEGASYSTGVDWARDQDQTEIVTIRYDIKPARLVAYERIKDEPYPLQVARFERRLQRYPGKGVHDAQGVGSAVSDYIDADGVIDYHTKNRPSLYNDYVMAVETGRIEAPMVESLHSEHKYVTFKDIYGSGHPPDGMSAMALAWAGVTGKTSTSTKRPGRIGRPRALTS